MTTIPTKYFTKKELVRVNDKSIKENRNRTLVPSYLNKLDDNIKLPIAFSMLHNEEEIRATFYLAEGKYAFLDMSVESFSKLPLWKGGG